METYELNNNTINKQKLARPASILLNVYPGTKGILNWKFASINEPILPSTTNATLHVTSVQLQKQSLQQNTPQTFTTFNYGSYQNAESNYDITNCDTMPKLLSANPSSSQESSSQEISQPFKSQETMGKRAINSEPNNNNQLYSSNNNNNQQQGMTTTTTTMSGIRREGVGMNLSLYGWRKQCLYLILFLLMILISINLALTLWILKVMEVSSDGMGQLKVVNGGIQLDGQAMILDELRTSHIRSRHGQPITFESSRNITFNTHDADGRLENQIFMGHDKLEIKAKKFRVSDMFENTLFYADQDFVEIGAGSLRIEGEGGAIFHDAVQTPLVRAEAGKELKLESPTRSLEMQASQEIFLQSRAGSIEATSLNDIKLHSISGSIRFDSDNIIFAGLKTAQPTFYEKNIATHKFYQVCVCQNGKLFLADSHGICAGDEATLCR
ncbi:unnamed protein product [Diamesa serratosioi]